MTIALDRAKSSSMSMKGRLFRMSTPNVKRLEFIQAIIVRLAQNSFQFKTWSAALVTVLLGFAAKDSDRGLALLGIYANAIFCLVDSYYLALERAYRDLYGAAINEGADEWGLGITKPGLVKLAGAFTSLSIWPFYLVGVGVSIAVARSV